MLTAEDVITLLQLVPLPIEGGFFRRTYTAAERIQQSALPTRYPHDKDLAGTIYFLLRDVDISALHRLLTDEVYHFYLGDPVELLLLYRDGSHAVHVLGHDLAAGQQVQLVVPRGVWQGSRVRPGGSFALMGTTMAPAYNQSDFELGARDKLAAHYPACAALIAALTYDE